MMTFRRLFLGVLMLMGLAGQEMISAEPLRRPHAKKRIPIYDHRLIGSDSHAGRLFVVIDSSVATNSDSMKAMTQRVWQRIQSDKQTFPPRKLSFFSQQQYARPSKGLSDEEKKHWRASYLAEYDDAKKQLVIYPEDKKRRQDVTVE